jgi:hypothetical protein
MKNIAPNVKQAQMEDALYDVWSGINVQQTRILKSLCEVSFFKMFTLF